MDNLNSSTKRHRIASEFDRAKDDGFFTGCHQKTKKI